MAQFGMGLLPNLDPDHFIRLMQKGEQEWGYHTLWLADERWYWDVYAAMTLAATVTRHVRLATAVTDPFSRHPAQTARGIATVDAISGGRAILNIGAGVSGLKDMGLARERPAKAVREAIGLIRAFLQGGPTEYHGETVHFYGGQLDFKARPDLPLYVAGRAPKMLEVAGELADGVMLGDCGGPAPLRYYLEQLRKGAARAGRSIDGMEKVAWVHTFIHKDHAVARQAARWMTAVLIKSTKDLHPAMGIEVSEATLEKLVWPRYHLSPENIGEAANYVEDWMTDHFLLAGDPDHVGRQCQTLVDRGITHIALIPWAVGEQPAEGSWELFARHVMPSFR